MALEEVTNTRMIESTWKQASLPVKYGGLGVRRAESLAYPAFIASVYSARGITSLIFKTTSTKWIPFAEEKWREKTSLDFLQRICVEFSESGTSR